MLPRLHHRYLLFVHLPNVQGRCLRGRQQQKRGGKKCSFTITAHLRRVPSVVSQQNVKETTMPLARIGMGRLISSLPETSIGFILLGKRPQLSCVEEVATVSCFGTLAMQSSIVSITATMGRVPEADPG
jgi:hypothetical protein